MSTPDQLADQADAALDAGGEDAPLIALRALTEAVREQTKALTALTQQIATTPSAASAPRAAPPKRLLKPPPPAPPAKGGDMWARLGLTEGERRRVTALFSDVSGFTAMSEKLDPEEANSIMKETMAELTAIIRKHDGYVEKFIGDAICAIFGAPISHEDEPERAARAALEMHAALEARALRRPDLPPLLMHIGINTGLVIAGTVGDGTQFGVMGDTVNTAARLMDKAVKRQTFVSAETARRIRHQFLLTDMGQYQMKGKDLPVQAFMLERQLSDVEAKQARRLHAPLIGRGEELSALRSAAARTTTGPDGAVALVLGDAGMGKTRLLDELASRHRRGHVRAPRQWAVGRRATVWAHRRRARATDRGDDGGPRQDDGGDDPHRRRDGRHPGARRGARSRPGPRRVERDRSRSWSIGSSTRTRRRWTSRSCSCAGWERPE